MSGAAAFRVYDNEFAMHASLIVLNSPINMLKIPKKYGGPDGGKIQIR